MSDLKRDCKILMVGRKTTIKKITWDIVDDIEIIFYAIFETKVFSKYREGCCEFFNHFE